MIEQIQKFQKGGNSRQMLRDAEGTFRAAYANASEDAKRQADALIQSASNYTSANPSVGRNNRLNQAQVYEEATRILRGEGQSQAPSISGGWGNRVINDFYALNKKQTTPATTSTPSKKYTNYTDLNTDYFGIVDDNEDLKARVVRLAINIGNNLASAAKAKGEGSVVRGLDKISDITTLTNTMQNIAEQVENGTMDPRAAQAAILKYAPQLGITDKTAWDAYFGETDDPTERDLRLQQIKKDGYSEYNIDGENAWLKNLATNKGYSIYKDAQGNTRIYDKDLNQIKNILEYNYNLSDKDDPTRGYGYGLISDEEGNVFMGDTRTIDQNSKFFNIFNTALSTDRDRRNNLYHDIDYIYGQHDSDSPYMQALVNKFGSFKGTDASALFQGDDKIFVRSKNGTSPYFTKDDVFGGGIFNNNAQFYKVDDQGNVTEVAWDELKNRYNANGWAGENTEQLGVLTNLTELLDKDTTTFDDTVDMGGRNFWSAIKETYGLDILAPLIVGRGVQKGLEMHAVKQQAVQQAIKDLGENASKEAIEEQARKIALDKAKKAVTSKAGKALLKQAGKKLGVRAGLQAALLTSGAYTAGLGTLAGLALGGAEAGIRYASYDNINEDRIGFIHNLLNAVAQGGQGELHTKLHGVSGNAELLQNLDYNSKKNYYVKGLYDMFKQDRNLWNQLSPAEQETFLAMIREYNDSYKKEGGVLHAAKGTVLSPLGEALDESIFETPGKTKANADVAALRRKYQESNEQGYGDDIYRKEASQTKVFKGNAQMTTADAFRLATMALDAASIVASFVPGAGTGVAAGLGVTTMGTDLIADVIDPAVSAGEVVKNLGMNAAFAGIGLIPGAKMHKVAKNIVKYAPKILTAAAGLGIAMDESTQATFKKIGDGTTKFNREDWRNISHVLSLIAGTTRGVRQGIANRKVKNSIVASDNVKLKGVKTENGSDYELPKQTVDSINAELAKATTLDEVKAIQQKYNNLPDEAIDAPLIKEGKLAGKYKLVGTESTADANKTYDSMRALWNADAKALKEQSKTGLGRAAIGFANVLGGGAYGANQRAMLSEGLGKLQSLQYEKYNPLIDWQRLRTKSGMETMSARPVIQEQFSNVGVEAQNAHRKELADFANLRRKEMLEKAGVNEIEAQIRENDEGIAGLSKAIEGNESGIAAAKNSIDESNIELGKLIHQERMLKTEPKKELTNAKRNLARAVTAAKRVLGESLTLDKNGYYTNKRTYTKQQKEVVAKLNSLIQARNEAQQRVDRIPDSQLELQLNKRSIQDRIKLYQKQIEDLTNEQLGGVRQLQRREALRDSGSLQNELRTRQRRAVLMNDKIQSEVNSKGMKLEGEVNSNIRVSGQTIKKGATVTSYEHLRTPKAMPPTGFNTLDVKRVEEVFPNLSNLRGAAYNPSTNEIVIWEKGGQIQSKFSHLRK